MFYISENREIGKSSKLKLLDIATSCVRIVFLKNNPFFPSVTLQWQQRNPNGGKVDYYFLYNFMPKILTKIKQNAMHIYHGNTGSGVFKQGNTIRNAFA